MFVVERRGLRGRIIKHLTVHHYAGGNTDRKINAAGSGQHVTVIVKSDHSQRRHAIMLRCGNGHPYHNCSGLQVYSMRHRLRWNALWSADGLRASVEIRSHSGWITPLSVKLQRSRVPFEVIGCLRTELKLSIAAVEEQTRNQAKQVGNSGMMPKLMLGLCVLTPHSECRSGVH